MGESEQYKIWNGPAGESWVEEQALLDALFAPFEPLLTEVVDGHVLDIGCGTGATTLAAARRGGRCVGVDISAPMIALARHRAGQEGAAAGFVCADAQDHRFEAGRFDTIISRFGVMFFADPVRAFANLRAAIHAEGRLRFIAWRSAEENLFMTAAERAATPYLPDLPAREPNAPGQFAFADAGRVGAILEDSGWAGITIAPIDVECALPADRLPGYYTKMGPVGHRLQQADEALRAQMLPVLRRAFESYVEGDIARFTAACWLVDARPA